MKFLVPYYSCLQNPWLGGYHPQDPHCLCPQLNLLNPPPKKIPGYATDELLSKQQSTNDIWKLTIEGSHLINQHDVADAFNNYFTSIIDKINSNNLDNMRHKNSSSTYSYLEQSNGNHYSSMIFKSFSTKEIISIIKSLKTKNSSGYD